MNSWLQNKQVQFAVGVAITLLAVKWLFFSGNVFFAVEAMTEGVKVNPEDPDSPNVGTFVAVWPVVWDILVTIMVGIGSMAIAQVTNLFNFISGQFKPSTNTVTAPTPVGLTPFVEQPKPTPQQDVDLLRVLAQSAAKNDIVKLTNTAQLIRWPYAKQELMDAVDKGDMTSATDRLKELNAIYELNKGGIR